MSRTLVLGAFALMGRSSHAITTLKLPFSTSHNLREGDPVTLRASTDRGPAACWRWMVVRPDHPSLLSTVSGGEGSRFIQFTTEGEWCFCPRPGDAAAGPYSVEIQVEPLGSDGEPLDSMATEKFHILPQNLLFPRESLLTEDERSLLLCGILPGWLGENWVVPPIVEKFICREEQQPLSIKGWPMPTFTEVGSRSGLNVPSEYWLFADFSGRWGGRRVIRVLDNTGATLRTIGVPDRAGSREGETSGTQYLACPPRGCPEETPWSILFAYTDSIWNFHQGHWQLVAGMDTPACLREAKTRLDGAGEAARFGCILAMTIGTDGCAYLVDGQWVRSLNIHGQVETLAILPAFKASPLNYDKPWITYDAGTGILFVSADGNIVKIMKDDTGYHWISSIFYEGPRKTSVGDVITHLCNRTPCFSGIQIFNHQLYAYDPIACSIKRSNLDKPDFRIVADQFRRQMYKGPTHARLWEGQSPPSCLSEFLDGRLLKLQIPHFYINTKGTCLALLGDEEDRINNQFWMVRMELGLPSSSHSRPIHWPQRPERGISGPPVDLGPSP